MLILADSHAHLYPCHDLARLVEAASGHLAELVPAARREFPDAEGGEALALCLTERSGLHVFAELAGGRALPAGWTATRGGDAAGLSLRHEDGRVLYVVAGRQVVTAEGVEVLALGADAAVPDGRPAAETIERIRTAGAVPVLAWAPGKWMFGRRDAVESAIRTGKPGRLLVGDSSLRARGWPEPALMKIARARGLAVVAGSDPLPFPGEEAMAGTYAAAAEGDFDPSRPAESLRTLLTDPLRLVVRVGRRPGWWPTLGRLARNECVRRRGAARAAAGG